MPPSHPLPCLGKELRPLRDLPASTQLEAQVLSPLPTLFVLDPVPTEQKGGTQGSGTCAGVGGGSEEGRVEVAKNFRVRPPSPAVTATAALYTQAAAEAPAPWSPWKQPSLLI